jgi:hypothetical protein
MNLIYFLFSYVQLKILKLRDIYVLRMLELSCFFCINFKCLNVFINVWTVNVSNKLKIKCFYNKKNTWYFYIVGCEKIFCLFFLSVCTINLVIIKV